MFILAEETLATAFKFAGIQGSSPKTQEEALVEFTRLTKKRENKALELLILSEAVSVFIQDEVLAWTLSGQYPLVVEISPLSAPVKGKQTLLELIREAIGVSI